MKPKDGIYKVSTGGRHSFVGEIKVYDYRTIIHPPLKLKKGESMLIVVNK